MMCPISPLFTYGSPGSVGTWINLCWQPRNAHSLQLSPYKILMVRSLIPLLRVLLASDTFLGIGFVTSGS